MQEVDRWVWASKEVPPSSPEEECSMAVGCSDSTAVDAPSAQPRDALAAWLQDAPAACPWDAPAGPWGC